MMRYSNRLFQAIMPILCCVFLILPAGCNKRKEPEETHQSEYVFTQEKKYTRDELRDIMISIGEEKNAHPYDEVHWSRKIMAMGVNTDDNCLDITVIDCDDEIFQYLLDNLKDYPVRIRVTDYWVMKDFSIVEEHKYIRHDDGSIEEYHYRRREEEETSSTSAHNKGKL